MRIATFKVPENRNRSGILIFDLFPLWKSNTQALPGFLHARIEKIKTASAAAAFEKNFGKSKTPDFCWLLSFRKSNKSKKSNASSSEFRRGLGAE